MSAIEQITTLLETLSFAEKLSLNERIATTIRKEGGGKGKSGKKAKAATDGEEQEAKPKRKAAAGTLAWGAFVKHVKTTQPDIFEGVTKESEKLVIVKGIRAEDMAAYDTFVADWKEKYEASSASSASASASASDAEAEEAEEAAPAPVPVPVVKQTPKEKLEALKAAKKVVKPAPSVTEEKKKAAPAPARAVKKAAAASKPKATEELQMAQKEIDGKAYWFDSETNGLWEVTGETFAEGSAWSGYYQADNEEEPIRYTENFGDE